MSDEPADVPATDQQHTRALVVRSAVPPAKKYSEYLQYLRSDFFYACAYCTMSEAEGQAVRFTIDHYHPRNARPDLEHTYANLMYACDECNQRKSDLYPPLDAQANGYRFYRPDEDAFDEHFELDQRRLKHRSNTGYYTIEAIDLNRLNLRRLRELRQRLHECEAFIAEGIRALRRFPIDRLPNTIKGRALKAIENASTVADDLTERIDELLRENARSLVADPDPEASSRARQRAVALQDLGVIYPGDWRAPRKQRRAKGK